MIELYISHPYLWIRVLEYDRDVYLSPFFKDQSAGVWQRCILITLIFGSECWSMTELYTYHPYWWISVLEYDRVVYLAHYFMDQSAGVWQSCILATHLDGSECWRMTELHTYHPSLWIMVLEYDRFVYLPPFFMDQSARVWESCILTTLLYGSECWSMTELYTCHPSLWSVLEYDRVVKVPPFFMDQSVGVWQRCILATLLYGSEC
jgi:hypothetical protein